MVENSSIRFVMGKFKILVNEKDKIKCSKNCNYYKDSYCNLYINEIKDFKRCSKCLEDNEYYENDFRITKMF